MLFLILQKYQQAAVGLFRIQLLKGHTICLDLKDFPQYRAFLQRRVLRHFAAYTDGSNIQPISCIPDYVDRYKERPYSLKLSFPLHQYPCNRHNLVQALLPQIRQIRHQMLSRRFLNSFRGNILQDMYNFS